jgi:hypothetical protein
MLRAVVSAAWGVLAFAGGHAMAAETPSVARSPVARTGAQLVETTCQSCHLLPDPSLLDRQTWLQESLKYMTPWLGLSRPNLERQPDGEILRAAHIFPDEPVFSLEEWRAVVAYFASNAPVLPPSQPDRVPVREGIPGFRAEPISFGTNPSFVTLLQIEPQRRRLWVGDGQDRSLRAVDSTGQTRWRLPVPSGPVTLGRWGDRLLITLIGRVFPSDETAGQVWSVPDGGTSDEVVKLLERLRRPVHTTVADLDRDGRDDLVVSAYGNRLGNLSWFRAKPEGGFEERVLEEYPGSLRTIPLDWNRDGRTDLLLLRGQAREGLSVLLNDGDGEFTPRRLVDQPPVFGYAAMEAADLDGDGTEEILLVNGDSGDYPSPPRAFHGLRVYSSTPEGGVIERFFFPMYGAYGVRARDFDGDGDRDLALISFFPDYAARPLETVVLLRNEGRWRFEAFALPAPDATRGRWLVMDAGDLDGDGDDDIVLGSFFRGPPTTPIPPPLVKEWETNGVSVLVLRNTR